MPQLLHNQLSAALITGRDGGTADLSTKLAMVSAATATGTCLSLLLNLASGAKRHSTKLR